MVKSGTPQWERWRLHNGANIYIQQRFGSTQIGNANIAACGLRHVCDTANCAPSVDLVLAATSPNTAARMSLSNFASWHASAAWSYPRDLPPPELPTTIVDRRVAADNALSWGSQQYLIPGIRYLGHSDRGKLWVLGVCGTGLPTN